MWIILPGYIYSFSTGDAQTSCAVCAIGLCGLNSATSTTNESWLSVKIYCQHWHIIRSSTTRLLVCGRNQIGVICMQSSCTVVQSGCAVTVQSCSQVLVRPPLLRCKSRQCVNALITYNGEPVSHFFKSQKLGVIDFPSFGLVIAILDSCRMQIWSGKLVITNFRA